VQKYEKIIMIPKIRTKSKKSTYKRFF